VEPRHGTVECGRHGSQPATFVCRHLVQCVRDRQPAGFHTAGNSDAERPDAWCSACEEKVQSTGGEWTDESESFAGVTLLCGQCYDQARRLNADHA
jgi:hypothetical protein